jgi:hypothetical protein
MARKLKSGHVQLGAQRVRVHVIHNLRERENIYGDVTAAKNVIRLAGDVAATQAVNALLHEVVHFLLEESTILGKEHENIACTLGRGLTGLFRDNPEWITAIQTIFRGEAKCPRKSTHKRKQTARRTRQRTRGQPDKPIKRRATRRT